MINYFNYAYSNDKGVTKAGDVFNSSLNMGPADELYSSGLVKDHEVTSDTSGEIVLDWTPVKVATFSIEGEAGTGFADQFGNITGDITGRVTPAGTIKLNGVTAATKYKVTYRFDNTSVKQDGYTAHGYTNAPAIELQIKSVPVNAQTRTLRA